MSGYILQIKQWKVVVAIGHLITTYDIKSYSLFTLIKPHSPLRINGERGFLRVNRLYVIYLHHSSRALSEERASLSVFIYILHYASSVECEMNLEMRSPCSTHLESYQRYYLDSVSKATIIFLEHYW